MRAFFTPDGESPVDLGEVHKAECRLGWTEVSEELLAKIKPGVTKREVLEMLGPEDREVPSALFEEILEWHGEAKDLTTGKLRRYVIRLEFDRDNRVKA